MINICYITDNNYIIPTMTSIISILKNCNSCGNIFVLSDCLKQGAIKQFENLSNKKFKIIARNIENPTSKIETHHKYVSNCAMIKFLLPDIFNDIDKILYIDGDTLILQDLSELFYIDTTDTYAAVVKDMDAMLGPCHHHKKFNFDNYFNSGMMLLNLKKMRDDNIQEQLIKNKCEDKFKVFMDQDALNKTFNQNVIFISPKYNLMKANLKFTEERISQFYDLDIRKIRNIIKKPTILHLTNIIKPWNSIFAVEFNIWFSYLKKIPNSELKQKTMKKLKSQKEKLFLKQIFSVKNSDDKKHKVITIFGLKFKFKSKKLIDRAKYENLEKRLNALINEVNTIKNSVEVK